jgi:hypothetical protein
LQRARTKLTAYAVLGLTGTDTLDLLARAPDPARAAKLTAAQISAVPRRSRRHDVTVKTAAIREALRQKQLAQPEAVTAAYAATVRATARVIMTLNEQIAQLEAQVQAHFRQHPDTEIYLSQPGIGQVTGARVLAEFGDDPHRYASAKARKNYAGSSPITRASGRSKVVLARFVRNNRLTDALHQQALSALTASPAPVPITTSSEPAGAGHNPALRQLSNRLAAKHRTRRPHRRLTAKPMGCLRRAQRGTPAKAVPSPCERNSLAATSGNFTRRHRSR